MKHGKWYLALWEIILILGSIPLFRSVWMVFDRMEFMNRYEGILLSLVGGGVLCVMALLVLNKADQEHQTDSSHDST